MKRTLMACSLFAAMLASSPAVAQCGGIGCPADTNFDDNVDVLDLVNVILAWGPCPQPCPPFCLGDLNQDCVVDVQDLVGIILSWGPCPPGGGLIIPPGPDCWSTVCGKTQYDFADTPLPPGFFGPGSQPFNGIVQLGGPAAVFDTAVERLDDMVFPDDIPSVAQTPIQLVELNLVSCQPIQVIIDGQPTQWDVQVGLSENQPPPGQMTVSREHPDGGVFMAEFFVAPVFTFMNGPDVIGPVDFNMPILLQSEPAPWTSLPVNDPCSPDDCFNPGHDGGPCCVETCHESGAKGGELHCTTPAGCMLCPPPCGDDSGVCCEPNGTPGCEIPECCDRVCEIDPFCCDIAWSAACAEMAHGFPQCGCLLVFEFPVDGSQSVPPSGSPGTGTGLVELDPNSLLLSWEISYAGLNGAVTAAHFHGPAPPGGTAGVQVNIGAGASPLTGSATINPTQAGQLTSGLWYVNIHTTTNPAGEVRGQVVP